jgi:kynurenine formamidase
MKIFDLSQPLNQDVSAWPYYPPFEVKYIKRKSEHGVNAQYIQTSNHMGTHLDAPRHFVTNGMTIDEIPMTWLYGPGVIVDVSDEMDNLAVYTPEMIERPPLAPVCERKTSTLPASNDSQLAHARSKSISAVVGCGSIVVSRANASTSRTTASSPITARLILPHKSACAGRSATSSASICT